MIDMRDGEEPLLQPHSQVRHELMHNQYNQLKEDESHWQDDLAKWKSRRRSISQDLIKKEEERKMMEQMMTGDTCISQRRRSIKTYREIVEDKERREEELRIAYKNARSPAEASAILQRYAQRFSISEAVLERLQLPKLLDRSVSADPSCPFMSISLSPKSPEPSDMDPNGPLRYLRQQSAPCPKFTSTLEARVEEYPKDSQQKPQIRSRSSEPPSSRALSPKPVPLLTPKPYFSRPQADTWNNKLDGLLRVNGDLGSDGFSSTPDSLGLDSPVFQPCTPSPSTTSSSPAPVFSPGSPLTPMSTEPGSPVPTNDRETPSKKSEETNEDATLLCRPNSLLTDLQKTEESLQKADSQTPASTVQQSNANHPTPHSETKTEQELVESSSQSNLQSEVGSQQVSSQTSISQEWSNVPTSASAPGSFGYHQDSSTDFANTMRSPLSSSNPKLRWEFFAQSEELEKDTRGHVSVPGGSQARRADRWSWDPDEERKRQERWQQEQERMLQDKYRREQEKLKQEWERAQREVAEEERKYHEEEQKILEETVTPLTPLSPSRDPSSSTGPHDTIVRSLADWERKQELLAKGNPEECKLTDRTSDISTADESMKTARSSLSQSMSLADTVGHSLQNGQKPPSVQAKPSSPANKQQQEAATESGRQSRTGERRSGPLDNNHGCSSSKPPASPTPPAPDTLPPAPNRSVSGKKLCSSCGQPLGKGAAMIIETLSLYFHIQCFKCGVCKGQLGDTTTGTDVRIRNGLLNCHQCYIRSRSAGQPTML